MGNVNIALANNALGSTLQTDDGIVGLVCTGGIDGYVLGDPLLITSLANATAQGVTAAGSPFLWRHLQEFYLEAGTGAALYLLPVANTVTLPMMAGADYAVNLLNYAGGKIKVLAFETDDTDVYGGDITLLHGLNGDVYTLLASMVDVANDFFSAQKPFRYVIGGTSYQGVPADLTDQLAGTSNSRGAIFIGDTNRRPGGAVNQAAIGLLLGRIAAIPVQRKVSRVKSGALSMTAGYVGSFNIADPAHINDVDTIAGRGYITFKTYPGVAGIYFSGDPTCSATTDDYHFLCRGRIIDKAHIIAYTTFVQDVDDEIDTVEGGKPEPLAVKNLEQKIVNALTTNMVNLGNCSSARCVIDLNQDVVSTNTLHVQLRLRPVGYLTDIEVVLGFER